MAAYLLWPQPFKMVWVTALVWLASHESQHLDDMLQGNLSQTYRWLHMPMTALNCKSINLNFLFRLDTVRMSPQRKKTSADESGQERTECKCVSKIMGDISQVSRRCMVYSCIIIWRSVSLSLAQRRPINHSWMLELFSQAQRHDNSSVTAQPVSKYSICHPVDQRHSFSWVSSLWLFLSTSSLSPSHSHGWGSSWFCCSNCSSRHIFDSIITYAVSLLRGTLRCSFVKSNNTDWTQNCSLT